MKMATMTAVKITEFGSPQVLQAIECEIPTPTSTEVLIKVAAAGVNRPDIMQRQGLYPPPPGASEIPGLEVTGTIVATGSGVNHWQIGDRVCALVTGGGYAQYCLTEAELCLPIPQSLSLIETAGLPETLFTVWSNLFDRAGIQAGETLLIHGGASGIGTIAIQLANAFDVDVYITAGSDEKCRFCESLGAKAGINYKTKDFVVAINTLTQDQGVNVIVDMIGSDYLARNIKCLADEGRLVQIAIQHGAKSEVNLLPIMLKRLTITGSTLRARSTEFKANIAKNLLQKVWPLIGAGQIKPIIHSSFALTDAASAHQLMESSQHTGKIILKVL